MRTHNVFENRYYVTANIIIERPLHIGKGVSLEPTGTDLPVIKSIDGKPYIPGSSIKGVMRSEIEKILRTLDLQKISLNGLRLWACDILDEGERCIPPRKGLNPQRKSREELEEECRTSWGVDEEKLTEKILGNSCTACKLFGSTEIASRIYVKDAFLNGDFIRTEIRDGIAIDRDTGTVRERAKFDYEIVPVGTKFKLEIIIENVEEWEVGLFGLFFKLWEKGEVAIGGRVSAGLGWSRIEGLKIEKVDKGNLIDYLIEEKRIMTNLDDLINAFRSKLKRGE